MTTATEAAAPSRPGSRSDLRVWKRFTCDVPVSCLPPSALGGKDLKWTARIGGVSSDGLCLILRRRFEPGAGLAIDLPAEDGSTACTLLARVKRVRAEPDGSWALGCAFISRLSDDEVQQLLNYAQPEAAPPPAAPVVPSATRPSPPANSMCLSNVSFRGVLPNGRLWKRHIKRLTAATAGPLKAGRTVGLRVHGLGGYSPRVMFNVIACHCSNGQWILDCRFVEAPPADVFTPTSSA